MLSASLNKTFPSLLCKMYLCVTEKISLYILCYHRGLYYNFPMFVISGRAKTYWINCNYVILFLVSSINVLFELPQWESELQVKTLPACSSPHLPRRVWVKRRVGASRV